MYRAIRESVQISGVEDGPNKLNRCNEWGAPRVPVLIARGGDDPQGPQQKTVSNPDTYKFPLGLHFHFLAPNIGLHPPLGANDFHF